MPLRMESWVHHWRTLSYKLSSCTVQELLWSGTLFLPLTSQGQSQSWGHKTSGLTVCTPSHSRTSPTQPEVEREVSGGRPAADLPTVLSSSQFLLLWCRFQDRLCQILSSLGFECSDMRTINSCNPHDDRWASTWWSSCKLPWHLYVWGQAMEIPGMTVQAYRAWGPSNA